MSVISEVYIDTDQSRKRQTLENLMNKGNEIDRKYDTYNNNETSNTMYEYG